MKESNTLEHNIQIWLDIELGSDFDKRTADFMEPIAQGVTLLDPLASIPNSILTLISDKNIFEEKVNTFDKASAVINLIATPASFFSGTIGTAGTVIDITNTTVGTTKEMIEKAGTNKDKNK